MQTQATIESWKSQPYVWMLILIPFTAVVVGMIMLSLAIESDTGLVVDDYYKKGKQINRVLERDQAASSMGLSANIDLDVENGKLEVRLKANSTLITNEQISLGLFHATKPGMDQTLLLNADNHNTYTTSIGELGDGRWHVHLSTDTWRLTGSLYVPGGNSLQLTALPVN